MYYRILELKRTTIRLLEVKEKKEEPAAEPAAAAKKEKQGEEKTPAKAEKRPAAAPLESGLMEKGLVVEKIVQERSSQPGEKTENEWKEVQLQISENGVMSVRNMKNSECSPKPAVEAPQASSGCSPVAQSASMTPVTHTVSAMVASTPPTKPTTSNGPIVSLPSELTTSIVPSNYTGPPRLPSSKPILSVSKVTKDQVKKDFNNVEANKLSISRVPAAGFKEKGEALNKIVSKLSPNERVIGNTSVTIRPVLPTPPVKTFQPPVPQPQQKVQKAERKPQQTVRYKTLTSPTKQWNPSIDRTTMLTMKQNYDMSKPPRFFKMRNMPRYLGNPASGVKPMYSAEEAKEKPRSPTKLPPPYTPGSPKGGKSPYPEKTTWTPRVPSPAHSGSMYNSNPYLLYSGFPGSFNPDPSILANANPDLVRSMFANSAYHPSLPPSINMLFNTHLNVPRPSMESPPSVQRIPRTKSPGKDDKVDKPIPNLIPAMQSHPRSPTLPMPPGSIPPHPSHPPGSLLPGTSVLPPRLPPPLSIASPMPYHNSLMHQTPMLSPHHPLGSPKGLPIGSPSTSIQSSPPKPQSFSPKSKPEQKSPNKDKPQDPKPQTAVNPPKSTASATSPTKSNPITTTSPVKSSPPNPQKSPPSTSSPSSTIFPKTESEPPKPSPPPDPKPTVETPNPTPVPDPTPVPNVTPNTNPASTPGAPAEPKPVETPSEAKTPAQAEAPSDNNNISKDKDISPNKNEVKTAVSKEN